MSIPNPSARRAIALPIAPKPRMPMRSPHTLSVKIGGSGIHWPARTMRSNIAVRRIVANSSDHAASATHSAAADGELVIAMPRLRAAATSMPS
jgi:hypothetical protein